MQRAQSVSGRPTYVFQHAHPSAHATTPWYRCSHRLHVSQRLHLSANASSSKLFSSASVTKIFACSAMQSRFDERRLRIVLPKIKELQGLVSARDFGPFKGFLVAADVLPLQEDLARFTNALRWALYSWGDDGERANVFFADFAKDGYQAKGYFGFVDECGDYSPWGHTWAVGTRAELDAAGWAEEAFPNEDVADY